MKRYINADTLIDVLKDHYSPNDHKENAVIDEVCSVIKMQSSFVPREDYEILLKKYDLAVAEREANVRGFTDAINTMRRDVAMEIFAEIEQAINYTAFANCWSEGGFRDKIAELKKKYIGE